MINVKHKCLTQICDYTVPLVKPFLGSWAKSGRSWRVINLNIGHSYLHGRIKSRFLWYKWCLRAGGTTRSCDFKNHLAGASSGPFQNRLEQRYALLQISLGLCHSVIQAPSQAGVFWETRSKTSLLQSCRVVCPCSHCRKSAPELETALLPALLWSRNWHANKNRTNTALGGPVLVQPPRLLLPLNSPGWASPAAEHGWGRVCLQKWCKGFMCFQIAAFVLPSN